MTLAAVGMYGVVAYAVTRPTREIGVRIAFGADPRDVLRLVMWEGLKPAVVGILLGGLGAFVISRVMTRLLYDVQARDPLTLSFVVVLLLAVAGAACAVPAYRATRIPPATALRTD